MSAANPSPPTNHVADLLPGFVNGTLARLEREQVMRHLPDCPGCSTDLQAWQVISEATRATVGVSNPATPALLNGVWAALDTLDGSASSSRQGLDPSTHLKSWGREAPEKAMNAHALPIDGVLLPERIAPLRPRGAASRPRLLWPSLVAVAALMLLAAAGMLAPGRSGLNSIGGLLPFQQGLPPDVPTFRGNPARTGEMPGPGPAAKPDVLWQVKTSGRLRSVPALGDGVIYVASENGWLYAFGHATGEERWRFEIGGEPVANPTVADGVVYVGNANPSMGDGHGTLFALDAATGSELWRLPDVQAQSPLVVDGTAYVGIADGFFLALDTRDGAERWRADTGPVSRGATFVDGVVYVGGRDGYVYALDAATGKEHWRFLTEGGTLGTIAVADGMVYEATFDGPADQLYALDAATGEERWRFAAGARLQPPAVADGVIYLPAGDGSLYALDANRGTLRWRFAIDNPEVDIVALVADAVYVGGAFPTLYAVDAASGEERWHIDLDGTVGAAPIVSGGIIYVGTETGSLYALGERGEAPPLVLEAPADSGAAVGPAAFLWQAANGSEPIAQPGGIALAPDGAIWVVEGGASRILIFSPDGVFLEPWGTPGPSDGEFNFVLEEHGGGYGSIGFDREGNIYVLDSGNFRVQKFDRNREFVTAWGREGTGDGEFAGPVTMTVDKDGNVYVGDDVRGDIQKFDSIGTLLDIVGSRGEGDGQFACIPAFGVDGQGNLYVPDCVNNEIQKFGPDGEFVVAWGSAGRGDGQFRLPVTAVVDAAGNVFISDAANSRVQVLAPDGTFLTAWGEFGTGDGQFGETSGLALDGAGHIYVTDYVHGRLQKFRLQPPLAEAAATPPAA